MKNYLVIFIDSVWYSLNIDDSEDFKNSIEFNAENSLITFQTSDLIREIKAQKINEIPRIVDLESFDKQMSQEGREFRNYSKWKALNFLKHHKVIDSEFQIQNNIKLLLEHLVNLYNVLIEKDEIETKRFNSIEVEVNKLIHERQEKGIRIKIATAQKRCKELEKKVYQIKNTLQHTYKIFSPDEKESQKDYLSVNNYNIIESLQYSFKIRRKTNEVCNLFYDLIRTQNDLDSLLYLLSDWGGKKRVYPLYLGFGTITSRIILRQPSLQNLRRENRDFIIPDVGMRFLYIDYSQFEAGILASLSNDDLLIQLYNSDIYSDLAEKVLKNKEERQEAKIIFYRYMYGDTSLESNALEYFSKFPNLQAFKQKIEKEIYNEKKIGTSDGNFRIIFNNESNWALSHKIQSTASLIYKKALLRVYKEVREVEFLIPMHDGTVYQLSETGYDKTQSIIKNIYIEVFKDLCPQITPRVTCKDTFN